MRSFNVLHRISIGVFVGITACLVGWQSEPQVTYAETLSKIAVPQTDVERQKSCAWIRSEIARMRSISASSTTLMAPMFALAMQAQAQSNIAALESRAAEFRCSAAFAERQPPTGIQACVAACRENTSRTPEQCFDSCNH